MKTEMAARAGLVKDETSSAFEFDSIGRKLVEASQSGLPLTREPFREIAARVGVSDDVVEVRFQDMLRSGVIRRIAAVPNHYRLGFTANGMSVWDIDDTEVDSAGHELAALEFVTHCYRRPRRLPIWPYNLFAMVHGETRAAVWDKVAIIATQLGARVRGYDVLFSTRILKKTGLRLRTER